jgi:hypothetical protein
MSIQSNPGTRDLASLRELALQLVGETPDYNRLSGSEEAFEGVEWAACSGNTQLAYELEREAEAGYREAILLGLHNALARVERGLPESARPRQAEVTHMLSDAHIADVSTPQFLEVARITKMFVDWAAQHNSPPVPWIDRIQTVTETFKGDSLDGWTLTEGAKVLSIGEVTALEIAGEACAEWTSQVILDGRLDFRYRQGGGAGLIMLRWSSRKEGEQGYILRLEKNRMALQRKEQRRMRSIGNAPLTLNCAEWYDISVWLSGGTTLIAVDARPILEVADESPLLTPGHVALSGRRAYEIAYRDVHLTAVPRGTLHLPVPGLPYSPLPDQPLEISGLVAKIAIPPTPTDVPLEVKPYLGPVRRSPINAGAVPPNYIHTWAIDVKDIASFSLQFSGIQLQWDAGDAIEVFDFTLPNPLIGTYRSDADLVAKQTAIQQPPVGDYKRLYLTLRTGPGGPPRQFQVAALHTMGVGGNREALLVGDDLNYDRLGPLVDPSLVDGQEKLYAPWKPESPGVPIGVSMPAPSLSEGWYLLARNTRNREAGFLSLLYYNERTSRLRAYLYNVTLSTDATYYQVTFSLATRAPGAGFVQLNGAFFNIDPRPQRWSTASFIIPIWPQKHWAFVETPLLYPMAEKLPAAQHPSDNAHPAHYYRPLYEEACEHGLNNAKLVVTVQGYQLGAFQGDLVGQGIGEAIQQSASSGISGFDMLKGAASAIMSGIDYYDKGKSVHKALQDFLNTKMQGGTPMSELQGLQALVGLGASAIGGFLGVVGLGIGIYQAFFAKPEPLRLALELVIRGSMAGSMFTPLMPASQTFFLPGRWSIWEAAQGNFPADITARVDAEIARYDRTLGHFGFRYDPGQVNFRLLQAKYAYEDLETFPLGVWSSRYIFPASDLKIDQSVDPPTPNASLTMPEWLPVIYNPYAEIVPLKPIPVATASDNGIKLTIDATTPGVFPGCPEPWFEWLQDVSPESHVVPEPDDQSFPRGRTEIGVGSRMTVKVFPYIPTGLFPRFGSMPISLPSGIWLSIPPDSHVTPASCQNFTEYRDVPVHTWWDVWFEDHGSCFIGPSTPGNPYPIRDVLFYWDVAYYHYPRTRQAANGNVPLYRGIANLLSPVSIDHRQAEYDYTDDEGGWFSQIDWQKSLLLLE